jgi:hypothetical protein
MGTISPGLAGRSFINTSLKREIRRNRRATGHGHRRLLPKALFTPDPSLPLVPLKDSNHEAAIAGPLSQLLGPSSTKCVQSMLALWCSYRSKRTPVWTSPGSADTSAPGATRTPISKPYEDVPKLTSINLGYDQIPTPFTPWTRRISRREEMANLDERIFSSPRDPRWLCRAGPIYRPCPRSA